MTSIKFNIPKVLDFFLKTKPLHELIRHKEYYEKDKLFDEFYHALKWEIEIRERLQQLN